MIDSTAAKVPIAAALAGMLTGNDILALFGGLMGALYAMTSQESVGAVKRTISVISITTMALFATWFITDTLPALAQSFGLTAAFEIGKGRAFVAFVFGYFSQTVILPGIGNALGMVADKFGKRA